MRTVLTSRPRLPVALPLAAAGLLAAGGWVHWCLYRHGYRYIPAIGPLFMLNALSSLTLAVLVALRRELLVRVAGLLLAGASLAAFVASRTVGLLSFRERGLQPAPQAPMVLAVEVLALVVLAATYRWDRALARTPGPETTGQARVTSTSETFRRVFDT
ncbi:MAG TPA: hypothetical protein VJ622_19390 [Acidimicrobiia bacterium]|nr:hypothetical protein [Acidimicrobiia bacterium]